MLRLSSVGFGELGLWNFFQLTEEALVPAHDAVIFFSFAITPDWEFTLV